jgi:hypothetical protein
MYMHNQYIYIYELYVCLMCAHYYNTPTSLNIHIVHIYIYKQLLAEEFGTDEIYENSIEYFVQKFSSRFRSFKQNLERDCPEGITFQTAFERLKNSLRQARNDF